MNLAPLPFIAQLPHCLIAALLLLSPQAIRPTGTATVIGHVVDGVSGQRLSGVTVSIAGGGLPAAEKTVSDTDGEFVFRALPAGTFSFGTKRVGYLDGKYGQRRPAGPSRSLKLADGERRDDVTILIFKPAAITGTVTDEAGEPAVKIEVRAYLRSFVSGRPVLTPTNGDQTDDRGMYRIGRLPPGDYVIAVPQVTGTPASEGTMRPNGIMVRDNGSSAAHLPPLDGKIQKFPTTYYVAGQNALQATAISLGVGDVRRNADVMVRPVKAFNISGSVTVARGEPRGVELALVAVGEDEVGGDRAIGTAVTGQSGAFSFPAVPAGQYVLRAMVRPTRINASSETAQWAEQLMVLNDKDLNDVSLFLRVGMRVSGRFEVDGSSDDSGNWTSGLTVSLDPASSRYANAPTPAATFDASGKSFTFDNVLPGRYLLRVGAGSNRAVKSVTYQGRDAWLTPFTVDASDINGVVATLTDHPTIIAGTVTGTGDLGESSVLVFPQDPQTWTDFGTAPITIRVIDITNSGTFEVRGLPAGDYLLVAFDQDTSIDFQNPAFLQAAARVATRLRVGDGEKQSADLKIVTIK